MVDDSAYADGRLKELSSQVKAGRVPTTTVRELLSWFGALRRGYLVAHRIRTALKRANLRTDPDFESAYIDSVITFVSADESTRPPSRGDMTIAPKPAEAAASAAAAVVVEETEVGAFADPTYRVSKLAAANRVSVSVPPDASLKEAITVMLASDFSQLPVMTGERDVKGIVSWASIGCRLALGKQGALVREMMDQHQEIRADASLGMPIDRPTFTKRLEKVRQVRNDVMHFDPDGIPEPDLDALRDFASFLQRLQAIGAT